MNCTACNRELKNHTATGMGPVCEAKNKFVANAPAKPVRVEILSKSATRRSYLVFTSPRFRVVVTQDEGGKTAICDCRSSVRCEHIDRVAEIEAGN